MGMFSDILEKLGFEEEVVQDTMPYRPKPAAVSEEEEEDYDDMAYEEEEEEDEEDEYAYEIDDEIEEVDVMAQLEELADEHDEDLNWQTSIVDLLKLLELDSSLSARKALAKELGCPAKKMSDSAQMNMWLHKTVLRKLAQNGGNIPSDLLD